MRFYSSAQRAVRFRAYSWLSTSSVLSPTFEAHKFKAHTPGSNRRRLAWEFSQGNDVFSWCSKNLSAICRSGKLLLMSSNFNYFRPLCFCLGHVLGTRFFVSSTLKLCLSRKRVDYLIAAFVADSYQCVAVTTVRLRLPADRTPAQP
jgi:hypothetical protein